jgi:hypothetical protein
MPFYTWSDGEGFHVPSLSSLVKFVLHVWAGGVQRGQVWGRGEASSLWETGQSIFNMWPACSEVHAFNDGHHPKGGTF